MNSHEKSRKKILVTVGTRPDAIKMIPLYMELKRRPGLETLLLSTGQQRDLLRQVFEAFSVEPDIDLGVMTAGQTPGRLTAALLNALEPKLAELAPDLVLVHGDTTTAFGTALACFYSGVRVAHIEAGLRSGDLASPFPEELNRRAIARIASLHFAPSEEAIANLADEGIAPPAAVLSGNTVLDAMKLMMGSNDEPTVLITLHRREKSDESFREILTALKKTADEFLRTRFLYLLHPNPRLAPLVHGAFAGATNVRISLPLAYPEFLRALHRARAVVTDSGGIQEEAAAMGVRTLIVREETERDAGIKAGTATLVGCDPVRLRQTLRALLSEQQTVSAWISARIEEELLHAT